MAEMTNAEKITRIKELLDYDHGFISPEGVRYFSEPFGLKGRTYTAKDTRQNPKGLTLSGPAGHADGQDADALALQIARHLGLSPPIWQTGRGFRLRTFVQCVVEHLEKGE